MKKELVKAQDYGIEAKQEQELLGNLPQIKKERDALELQYSEVIKMDIENPESWKIARELRMLIQKNRTQGINVWHKNAKDFFLKGGQFVDAIKRKEVEVNERMESNLLEIEKFEEVQKQKEIKRLNDLRISEIDAFKEFVPFGINLGEMQEDDYQKLLQGAKMQFEAEQERLRKEEEERLRIEKVNKLHSERKESLLDVWQFVDLKEVNFGEMSSEDFNQLKTNAEASKKEHEAEQERIKKENERLEKERIAREKEIEAERKKQAEILAKQKAESDRLAKIEFEKAEKLRKEQEATLERERQEKAKLEAELKAKRDAEFKAENERKEAERKAKEEAEAKRKAPIKDQMNSWIENLIIPEIDIENEIKDDIILKFESFKKWAKNEINKL